MEQTQSLPTFDLYFAENVTKDEILAGILNQVKAEFPGYEPEKSDPLYQLACAFTYRELLLRQRINDVAFTFCVELERANREKITPYGFKSYYIQKAKSCFGVKDATVEGLFGGIVQVYILIDWSQCPDAEDKKNFVERVQKNATEELNKDSVKMVNDTVQVNFLTEKHLTIKAKFVPEEGAQIVSDVIKTHFVEMFQKENKPGQQKSMSWLLSKLHQPGVSEVILQVPKEMPQVSVGEILVLDEVIFV
jgi:phage-related baseplate assembly protein